jgi:diguanylate cyclase (GGDEF)-like protein/PAS domain S-box-containing protein
MTSGRADSVGFERAGYPSNRDGERGLTGGANLDPDHLYASLVSRRRASTHRALGVLGATSYDGSLSWSEDGLMYDNEAGAQRLVARPSPHDRAIARFASLGLVIVLIAVPALVLWAAIASFYVGTAAEQASEVNGAYRDARHAVSEEESLERKYRLEPSAEVRGRHRAAAVAVVTALERAASLGASRGFIDEELAAHTQYLSAIDRMFAAIDANDSVLATKIDVSDVDPTFDKIEQRVLEQARVSQDDESRSLAQLAIIQKGLLIAAPIVFVLAAVLVLFFWLVLRSARRRAVEALSREAAAAGDREQRFRSLVHNTPDVILICAASGEITYQSPAAETGWGYAPCELMGATILTLAHPDNQPALRELWGQVQESVGDIAAGTSRIIELRMRDRAGDWRDVQLILMNLLHEPAVGGVVATIRDIRERKAFENQLTHQAFYDSLTGLANRPLLFERLRRALVHAARRGSKVGVVFIDLDNFKLINDSLGHQLGDELIVQATGRLQSCVRAEDTLARIGGDEFVVVLEHLLSEADALPVTSAIAKEFRRTFASMHVDTLARLELENDLRRGIAKGELRVHYQPIVTVASAHVTEVEALVRWQHPTRGLLPPASFISIAEETGLIVPLGKWVLEEACRQMAAWHAEVLTIPPMSLSVNLSPKEFLSSNLVEEVARILGATGLPPGCLKLEITEGVVMRDVEGTITTLWRLKELGVQIAIDDFGTGYSSLGYLKRLPVDVLKIDRSFVSGLGHNPEDAAIVRAIIAMAKSLGLAVTSEGVETEEQANLLKAWGCDRVQGYYYGKPLDGAATAGLLNTDHAERAVNHTPIAV